MKSRRTREFSVDGRWPKYAVDIDRRRVAMCLYKTFVPTAYRRRRYWRMDLGLGSSLLPIFTRYRETRPEYVIWLIVLRLVSNFGDLKEIFCQLEVLLGNPMDVCHNTIQKKLVAKRDMITASECVIWPITSGIQKPVLRNTEPWHSNNIDECIAFASRWHGSVAYRRGQTITQISDSDLHITLYVLQATGKASCNRTLICSTKLFVCWPMSRYLLWFVSVIWITRALEGFTVFCGYD